MNLTIRAGLIALHVAAVVTLGSGCAQNTDDSVGDTQADLAASTTASVAGKDGGQIYTSQASMLLTFRSIALANGKLPQLGCAVGAGAITQSPTLATCSYDPTKPQVTPDQWQFSDKLNRFTAPDEHRYGWVFVKSRNTWLFADKDQNGMTYAMLEAYNVNAEDPNAAATYMKPIEAWLTAHATQ